MARVGGRSAWIAWPVGILCAAVVVALGVLAVPALPTTVSFVGDMLRASSTAASRADALEAPGPATDCRSLYTPQMWSQLVWSPEALLSQGHGAPVSTAEAASAAAPVNVVTCHWRGVDGRWISTTVSTVSAEGASAVQATLSSQGFTCDVAATQTHCERTTGDLLEIHDLRGDRWVSSSLDGWAPEGYAGVVASRAFGE